MKCYTLLTFYFYSVLCSFLMHALISTHPEAAGQPSTDLGISLSMQLSLLWKFVLHTLAVFTFLNSCILSVFDCFRQESLSGLVTLSRPEVEMYEDYLFDRLHFF